MFCFCLQSSLLKLQALEAEGGPSADSSPEERPPAGLGSKELKSPCSSPELGAKGSLAMIYSGPGGENNSPGNRSCTRVCVSELVLIDRRLIRSVERWNFVSVCS